MSEENTFKTSLFEETKIIETEIEPSIPELPLVTFDLNFRTLQDFLAKIAAAINKNTILIRSLQEEIITKVAFPDMLNFIEKVNSVMPADYTVDTISSGNLNELVERFTDGTQKMCDKIQDLENFKNESRAETREIWNVLNRKVSNEEWDAEKKNLTNQINEKLKKKVFVKKYQKLKKILRGQEDSSYKKTELIEKTISELKTELLWKTNDIERLLQTRVNEQFVWDALDVLETKIRKQRDIQASLKLSRQQSLFEKFQSELKKLEESFSEDLKVFQVKSSDSHQLLIDQVAEAEKSFQSKHDHLNLLLTSKIQPLEFQLFTTQEKIESLEHSLSDLKPKVPENIDLNFTKVFEEIENIKKELEVKIEKSMINGLIETVKSLKQPVVQSPVQDLNDFWKFREHALKNLERVDRELDKIFKTLDLKSLKMLGKLSEERVNHGFGTIGQRLLVLERNQEEIFKELDRLSSLIKKIFNSLDELSNQSAFALISKKSLTANCLSCGKGEPALVPTIPHVQGLDGRFYKADLSPFRPSATSSDWKPEDLDSRSKSPISFNRLPRAGLNSIIGKDLINSLSSTTIHRPTSAKK